MTGRALSGVSWPTGMERMIEMKRALISTTALCLLAGGPALALEPSWPDLQDALYGDLALTSGAGLIEIDAPYR